MRTVPTLDGSATGLEFGLPAPEPTGVRFGLIELIAKARPALHLAQLGHFSATSSDRNISLRYVFRGGLFEDKETDERASGTSISIAGDSFSRRAPADRPNLHGASRNA